MNAGEAETVKLTVEIPVELRGRIRMAAARADMSMAQWAREALRETVEIEEESLKASA